jgi:hypothetical protein
MLQIASRATASTKESVQHKQWAVRIMVSIVRIALKGTPPMNGRNMPFFKYLDEPMKLRSD